MPGGGNDAFEDEGWLCILRLRMARYPGTLSFAYGVGCRVTRDLEYSSWYVSAEWLGEGVLGSPTPGA